MKPPMPYTGGKQRLADKIVDLMPPHHHYVETFAGALSVLLAKRPSPLETANDLDHEIITFWRVLRTRPDELERLCALTPHSRELYQQCRVDHSPADEVTTAWRVWVRMTQGRGSQSLGHSGWRFVAGRRQRMSMAKYLSAYLLRFAPLIDRLHDVSLECRPALELIPKLDTTETLFYVDPPYLDSVRQKGMYRVEMGDEENHHDLLHVLKSAKGKVILSGYRSELYDHHLVDWHRVDFDATAMTGEKRTESVWINYDPPTPDLLEVPRD